MSMFIKGINPPKSCYTCDWYNKVQCPVDVSKCYYKMARHPSCPLVSIHTPHGRLGDLDELKSKFRHGNGDDDADSAWISTIRRFITQAATIIEAED